MLARLGREKAGARHAQGPLAPVHHARCYVDHPCLCPTSCPRPPPRQSSPHSRPLGILNEHDILLSPPRYLFLSDISGKSCPRSLMNSGNVSTGYRTPSLGCCHSRLSSVKPSSCLHCHVFPVLNCLWLSSSVYNTFVCLHPGIMMPGAVISTINYEHIHTSNKTG